MFPMFGRDRLRRSMWFPGGGPQGGDWRWGHHSRFPGGRARRGDVRTAILSLLAERPMHGYEMIRELESRSGGVWRPSAGSIYPTLQLLEDEGLITGEQSGGKRLFSLTDAGRAEAEKQGGDVPPWQEVAEDVSPPAFRLRDAAFQVGAAVLQVARAGNEDQVNRTLDVLTDTRRRIYAILGEGE